MQKQERRAAAGRAMPLADKDIAARHFDKRITGLDAHRFE
jgi:hypothetical protein